MKDRKEYFQKYYQENKAKFIENSAKWKKANPEKARELRNKYKRAYRAKLKQLKQNELDKP